VVPRAFLGESLWGAGNFDNNMVHRLVRRTREKVEQRPDLPELVVSVPGVGYYFNVGRAPRE
jgi:DNA-binding response OmpR family regulator